MLKQRLITALILAPLVIAAVFFLPIVWFAGFFFLFVALAAIEWTRLVPTRNRLEQLVFYALLAAAAGALFAFPDAVAAVLVTTALFWAVAALCVVIYPTSAALVGNRAWMFASGLLVLVAAWAALVLLRGQPQGAELIVWVLAVVWSADIGAYFVGRAIGHRKLAPRVSPGKTLEGAAGGMLASVLAGGLLALGLGLSGNIASWLAAAALMAVVSIFGDLYESVLKRVHDVKDSGGLLPGHGGVLDRIDSLLAVLPLFAVLGLYGMNLLNTVT